MRTKPNYITVSSGDLGDLVTTTISYDYDPLYRLTSAAYSSGEVYTYTYDAVGNRQAMGTGRSRRCGMLLAKLNGREQPLRLPSTPFAPIYWFSSTSPNRGQ